MLHDICFTMRSETWVEQQGHSLAEFSTCQPQSSPDGLQSLVPAWDAMIAKINAKTGRDNIYGA